ncbi:MAG: hypothetical protein SVV80_05020 [Planctomycetota bacterium]|nr:hypothetical protein [Planctomycetota bacterium]
MLDRGYFDLYQQIIDAGSSFVARARDNAVFEVIEERLLDHDALNVGIVRDAVVRIGGKWTRQKPDQPLRIIEIECTSHLKTSGN